MLPKSRWACKRLCHLISDVSTSLRRAALAQDQYQLLRGAAIVQGDRGCHATGLTWLFWKLKTQEWKRFVACFESEDLCGTALYSVVLESVPSLKGLFKTPKALQSQQPVEPRQVIQGARFYEEFRNFAPWRQLQRCFLLRWTYC